jgi:hypothetical protein
MPRPRKSADQLRLEGTFRHDRHDGRADHDAAGPPLDPNNPPPGLTPRQVAIWRDLVMKASHGVLREADAPLVKMLTEVMDVRDTAARRVALEGPTAPAVEGGETLAASWRVMRDATTLATRLLMACGMTPAARLKVLDSAPERPAAPDPSDPWAVFPEPGAPAGKAQPKRPRH